jgi:aminoglycoside N3'-acetyltransferase
MAMDGLFSVQTIVKRGLRKLVAPVRGEGIRKVVSRMQRAFVPIGDDDLRAALDRLLGTPPRLLLMHSALSACGTFTAGPDSVLDTLQEYVGTLALVTHSYCYPEAPGQPGPIFDPRTTPSKNGLLTNLFRQRDGAARSIHATH